MLLLASALFRAVNETDGKESYVVQLECPEMSEFIASFAMNFLSVGSNPRNIRAAQSNRY